MDHHSALCAVMTRGHVEKDFGFGLYSDIVLQVLEERKALAAESVPNEASAENTNTEGVS